MSIATYEIKVYNAPEDCIEYKYMVARVCNGELWYYGIFNDKDRAKAACDEIGGVIIER